MAGPRDIGLLVLPIVLAGVLAFSGMAAPWPSRAAGYAGGERLSSFEARPGSSGSREGSAAAASLQEARAAVELAGPGDMTPLDRDMLALAKAAAAECSQALESAIEQGIKSEDEVFSTLYFPASPLTRPPTFSTFYDDYTDAAITPIEDRYLERNQAISFVVLVDRNGYLPSHNSKYSQARTGNPEADLKINRTKRIFNDATGFRAARNEQDFLLQVYRRDTGEAMKDLSVPVFVKGRRWGALRIGYSDG